MKDSITKGLKRATAAALTIATLVGTVCAAPAVRETQAAATHKITCYDTRYNDGTLMVAYFEIDDGTPAMCLCHEMDPPKEGQSLSTVQEYTYENQKNELLRKVYYYGWNGPGDIGGANDGEHYRETTLAGSVANGHDDNFYGYGQAFIDKIKNKPAAPKGFNVYKLSTGDGSQQDLGYWEYNPDGGLKLRKGSALTDLTDGNESYALAGAVYGVYSDSSCTKKEAELKVKKNGVSQAVKLDEGTYYIKEIKAPSGYKLDSHVYTAKVEAGETTTTEVEDTPKYDTLGIRISKIDAESGKSLPQGQAELKGAQFTVKFYTGIFQKKDLDGKKPARTWVIQTKYDRDEKAFLAALDEDHKVSGDAFYHDGKNKICLPIGTVTIEETKAPTGYLLEGAYLKQEGSDKKVEGLFVTHVTETSDGAVMEGGNIYSVTEQVIRGGVKVQKRDLETGEAKPLGGATLEGTTFTIRNKSGKYVSVDGNLYADDEVVMTMKMDTAGQAETAADALPYGTYEIEETEAPKGYLGKGVVKRTFEIRVDGVIVDMTEKDQSIQNQVKRGDFELTKLEEKSQKAMAGVSFTITSNTTGESHTFTTDENGFYSSASSWNLHSKNTNQGGAEDGLWFGQAEDGSQVEVNDELGALPYDTYTIQEIRGEGNKGKELYSDVLIISRDNYVVDRGNIENFDVEMKTTALDKKSNSHISVPAKEIVFVDTVSFNGVDPEHEYKLVGVIMNAETRTPLLVDGKPITAEKTFKPESKRGTADMEFTFDARRLYGVKTVIFEELYELDGEDEDLIAEHKDFSDKDQTITFTDRNVKIRTTAVDQKSGKHIAEPDKKTVFIDTISYEGLTPDVKHKAKAVLMNAETKEPVTVDGKKLTAEATFVPKAKYGTTEVKFEFNGSTLYGVQTVAFEEVYEVWGEEEELIAEHKDFNDKDQTVTFEGHDVKLRTTALDKASRSHVAEPSKMVTIVDTVTYEGVLPGMSYQVKGVLMDQKTGQPLKVNGKEVTAELTFIPKEAKGTIEMEFTFDGSALDGTVTVVFEEMYRVFDGKMELVGEHKDLKDKGQTVMIQEPAKPGTPVANPPRTGDHTNIALWLLTLAGSAAAMAVALRRKKNQKNV